MKTQNYGNYVRYVPAFHFFLVPLGFVTLASAIALLFIAERSGMSLLAAALLISLSLMAVMTMFLARTFACKVQDRAIRAEENLRHFAMTGRLLDPRLTMEQIIALRFASDEEWPTLCGQAASERMAPDAIKRSVRCWRADHNRV
ncbi:hypothetical protein J19TS2_37790 [Cohnella xylanilytica]|uniref:Uncharacterized protein n=1 Tax=Cohnella xylanilytica TaxID=557555 RepID=A0A841TWJ4_9BACL|nr:DUF6526 family protein [Cohnella xylanilytica]MBB6690543.1 hypothetical protein [Cohnella xylanilytica]GIO14224.1 hypothetical protein J19TS2_37790 [Cohnella xylanilytica]